MPIAVTAITIFCDLFVTITVPYGFNDILLSIGIFSLSGVGNAFGLQLMMKIFRFCMSVVTSCDVISLS